MHQEGSRHPSKSCRRELVNDFTTKSFPPLPALLPAPRSPPQPPPRPTRQNSSDPPCSPLDAPSPPQPPPWSTQSRSSDPACSPRNAPSPLPTAPSSTQSRNSDPAYSPRNSLSPLTTPPWSTQSRTSDPPRPPFPWLVQLSPEPVRFPRASARPNSSDRSHPSSSPGRRHRSWSYRSYRCVCQSSTGIRVALCRPRGSSCSVDCSYSRCIKKVSPQSSTPPSRRDGVRVVDGTTPC